MTIFGLRINFWAPLPCSRPACEKEFWPPKVNFAAPKEKENRQARIEPGTRAYETIASRTELSMFLLVGGGGCPPNAYA